MIFRYYIIGEDGRPYEQQVEVQDRQGRTYLQLEADAQRIINDELSESGAIQITLPDAGKGLDRYVPEVQNNFDKKSGTTNVGGRTINLSNPNFPTMLEGGTSPLLQSGTNLPPAVAPTMQLASSEGANGQTFYGDVNTGYGAGTPGMADSRGTTSAGNTPFNIDAALATGGFTQGMSPVAPANTYDPTNPLASGAGTAPDPYAWNPEFSRPDTIDTRPGRTPLTLTGGQFDFMTDESGGSIQGFESAAAKQAEEERIARIERMEREAEAKRLEEERIEKEKAGYLSNNNPVKDPIVDKVSGGGDWVRKLVDSKTSPDGTLLRQYEYTQYFIDKNKKRTGKTETSSAWFIVNADGADNLQDAEQFELPITEEAWNANKGVLTLDPNDILFFQVKEGAMKDELEEAWMRDATSVEVDVPDWFESVLNANGRSITPTTNIDGPRDKRIIYDFRSGEFDPTATGGPPPTKGSPEGPDPKITEDPTITEDPAAGAGGGEDAGGGGLGTFDPSFDYATGEQLPGGPGGLGQTLDQTTTDTGIGGNIISVNPVINYPGDALSDFLGAEGFAIPRDSKGDQMLLDRLTVLPGFPVDFLDPSNLFVEVVEEVVTIVPGEREGDPPIRQVETKRRFETNPAISATLELYGNKIKQITGSQESIDRIIQSQINASGGLLGPASTLSSEEYENLEVGLRNVASSGGRLTAQLKQGADGLSKLVQELTPLGKQELTQEALRQSGGLLGGYYTQDEKGEEVFQRGLNPEELLNNQNQQELLRIQSQNLPDLVASRYGALDAQNQRRSAILNQISNIYQNPTQLAAIVQAGGGPLLQLQQELRRTEQSVPGIPAYPTSPLLGAGTGAQAQAGTPLPPGQSGDSGILPQETVPNVNLDPTNIIGYADGVPITRDNAVPFSGNAVVNPATGMTTGLPLIQEYNPNLSEAGFNQLTPIQQQQALGSAAVFGKTPEEVQEDLLDFTPLGQRQALYGVGGTSSVLGRS